MLVICKDDSGFEDSRRAGYTYQVLEVGENSYKIKDSSGKEQWVGMTTFKISGLSL